jgi:CubicO group peptidase (beta-lactamase class C family)
MSVSRLLIVAGCFGLATAVPEKPAPVYAAAAHHRDFQTAWEGISTGTAAEDGTRFENAGLLRAGGPGVDEDTLFEIGSITKTFTGILLADAVLGGKATLDDSIAQHLPTDLLPPESPLRKVTLLDLATHTSGLPRLPGNLGKGARQGDPYAHYAVEDLYAYLRAFKESDFKDRGKVSYSNLGMGLLGHLMERISGKPYEELIREKIFDPLEMASSFVQRGPASVPPRMRDRFATGHSGGRVVDHWHIDALCGAGAIVSSARDLMRYATAHWAPGTPEKLRAAMEFAAKPRRAQVGLGWFVSEGGMHHDGGTGGFRSELRISLSNKTAAVRLMNSSGPATDATGEGDFTTLAGYWQGTLDTGGARLRMVLRLTDTGRAVLHSLDQGGSGIPADKAVHAAGTVRVVFGKLGGSFEGKHEGRQLTGSWTQGGAVFPLILKHQDALPDALKTLLAKSTKGDVTVLQGYWSGYLGGERGLFIILELDTFGGTGEARIYSPDQTPDAFPVTSLELDGTAFRLSIAPLGATYTAKLDGAGKLTGIWKQGPVPQRLTLTQSATRPERDKKKQ